MYKINPVKEGPDAGVIAGLAGNLIFFLIGIILLIGVLVATLRIVRSAQSPLEEISSFDDYEYTQSGGFNLDTPPIAPELPSADKIANSMYGGSKDIFEQPPPPMPSTKLDAIEDVVEEIELPAGVPPIPENGLPEGWTTEQWIHYGQQWINQQNQD
tara:strand:- start:455 stop:925 length:471 start_codon:yes stop_codon:yes gene_type:complete